MPRGLTQVHWVFDRLLFQIIDGYSAGCYDSAVSFKRTRTIGFFVHHQGRGHAKRCQAIIEHLSPGPVTVFCARPEFFEFRRTDVDVIQLPNFHGEGCRSAGLHSQPACSALDCAPLGVDALRLGMSIMARWMGEADPCLFVVDVSAEVTLLTRLCSVPAVNGSMPSRRAAPSSARRPRGGVSPEA